MSFSDQMLALFLPGNSLLKFFLVFLNVLKRWVTFSCTCENMEQYCCYCSDYWGSERYIGFNNVRVCVFPFHWGLCEKQPVYNGRHWDCYPPHSSFTHTSSFKGSLANFPLFMDHLISPYRASPISCVHWTHHKRADNYSLHRNNWKHSLSRV